LLYSSLYTVYILPIPTVATRDDKIYNQNPYHFFIFILLNAGCSVPEPYRSPDWALVPAQTGLRAEY